MTRLPQVYGRQLVKVLELVGYVVIRQRGSHIRLKHPTRRPVTVPDHKRIGVGLLVKILRDAEMTADKLRTLLLG